VTTDEGRLVIRVNGQERDPAAIWHVKAFTTAGSVVGLSPIQHARQAMGLGLGAEKFAATLFGNSAIPAGVLTTDHRVDQETADRWRARWRQQDRGIAILGDGARFQPVTVSPEESQFL